MNSIQPETVRAVTVQWPYYQQPLTLVDALDPNETGLDWINDLLWRRIVVGISPLRTKIRN